MNRSESEFGKKYGALTPHIYWDGETHYWTGMPVNGMSDVDGENPNCCQNLEVYEGGEVAPDAKTLQSLRSSIRKSGKTHLSLGTSMGIGTSRLRQKLYGQQSFSLVQFKNLCRLCGVKHEEFIEPGPKGERR